jgi:phosphoserine phosphatase RsbU/P
MFQILVIDDDPIIRTVLKRTLQMQGYQVTVTESGEKGIALALEIRPALVICDWLMGGIDGLEVCRHLKGDPELSQIFFILLTSRSGIEDRVKGLDAGADDFLPKPIEANELKARVRSGLRLYQSTQELQRLVQDLQVQKHLLETELAEAADYVRSLLPQPLVGEVATQFRFLPSSQLGGDCFDYFWLDPDYLALYLLDVSGHGLGAALLSVSVQNMLRSQSLDANFYQPSSVLRSLNELFDMSQHSDRYFTIWYGIYSQQKRQLAYASAGHPPAILISTGSSEIQQLRTRGMPIGMVPESRYVSELCDIPPESTLYLFSDGIYEIIQSNTVPWSLHEFIQMLTQLHSLGANSLDQLLQAVCSLSNTGQFEDDCSILQMKFR